MAKDITLKTRNGETRYPKTVTALVYENGTGKTLQTIIDEMRQVDSDTNTRTQHFKADVNNLDTLKNKTDIGLYNYVGTGWRGSVSVCYDSSDNVSQVALSSSTPSYNGNTLTWLSAQPCAMARTYTNGAWSHWEKVGAPVVNDLTTGGTDKALSAEMGKTLKDGLDALGPKCDQNKADIAALQEEVVEVGARAGSYDHIPLLGGQPMILFGSGAPVEANVPDNWIGFDDGGFEWIGTPSMIGQQYIDTTNGEKYVSIKNNFTLSWLKV